MDILGSIAVQSSRKIFSFSDIVCKTPLWVPNSCMGSKGPSILSLPRGRLLPPGPWTTSLDHAVYTVHLSTVCPRGLYL